MRYLPSGAAGVAGFRGFLAYAALTLPVSPATAADLPSSAVTYATTAGQPFAVRGVYHGDPIEADDLPPYLAKAVVAIEDRRFYEHSGIDLRGIARAALNNVIGSEVEGGSTITQQFARLRYLSPERSLRRKVQEAMLALWLETRLSKDEILARYLNSVYFGAGAVGADAAARRYFGKPRNGTRPGPIGDAGRADPRPVGAGAEPQSESGASAARGSCSGRCSIAARSTGRNTTRRAPSRSLLAVAPEPEPGQNYFLDTADAEVKRLIGEPPLDLTVTTTIDPAPAGRRRSASSISGSNGKARAAMSARPRWSRWRPTARSSR